MLRKLNIILTIVHLTSKKFKSLFSQRKIYFSFSSLILNLCLLVPLRVCLVRELGGEGMGRILTEGRGGGGILRLFYRFTLKLN